MMPIFPVLQLAVGPVILISGIGLILLSMTNRFGRTVDRARVLAADDRVRCQRQIEILAHRATLLRRAITLASISILFAAILIATVFVAALLRMDVAWAVALLFVLCIGCLIAALIAFIQDVTQSLIALRLELGL
jgi:ABC-type polysaccharide/polyol phosphate export permease